MTKSMTKSHNKKNYTKNYRKNRHNKTRKYKGGSLESTVFLLHSENCIHCKKLMPEWQKMKKQLAKKGVGVLVKEIEANSDEFKKINEIVHPDVTINGYPTIVKKKGGKIEYYNGDREAAIMSKWASKN